MWQSRNKCESISSAAIRQLHHPPPWTLFQNSAAEGGLGGLCNASFVAHHNSWGFPLHSREAFPQSVMRKSISCVVGDVYFLKSKATCKWEKLLVTFLHFPFWRNVSFNLRKFMLKQIMKMQIWKYLIFASLGSAHHPTHNPIGTHSYLLMDSLATFPNTPKQVNGFPGCLATCMFDSDVLIRCVISWIPAHTQHN